MATNGLIFLDLSADRYFALPTPLDTAFRKLISTSEGLVRTPIAPLVEAGIIVETDGETDIRPPSVIAPRNSALEDEGGRLRAMDILPLVVSQLRMTARLRSRAPWAVIKQLALRKKRVCERPDAGQSDRADDIARAFVASRLLVSMQDRCLMRSLALLDTLIAAGVRAELIIGVKSSPFAAHAWVQRGDRVLNDRIDHVSRYQPILVI